MATNGLSGGGMGDIIKALELIYDPSSTNDLRLQALGYLEKQKNGDAAAHNGYLLASQAENLPLVRYFGLSMLENVVRHMTFDTSNERLLELRNMVMRLAEAIRPEDPPYYRNKVAQLWADVAKRSWGVDWLNMDETLVKFWTASLLHKELILTVLETLSEDIFYREDVVSSLRGSELNRALVEVFTPLSVFEEVFPERDHHAELRSGTEGWLGRTCAFLDSCVQEGQSSNEAKACILKALAVLRTALAWAIPKAVVSCHCVASVCRTLALHDEKILLAAVEALHALYGRSNFELEEFQPVVQIMYQSEYLSLLRKLFIWSIVDPRDIDETKYAITKKSSELLSYVATYLEEKRFDLETTFGNSVPSFLEFLIEVLRHQSLTVSIPVLHSWSKLLSTERIGDMEIINRFVAPLLEICSQRLVRWESLPDDSDDPTVLFLNEDIDTLPERHAFVGNYRRYCSSIIEVIVQKKPHDAIPHILSTVDHTLSHLYDGQPPFKVESFRKSSLPLMRADTQFAVVEATLKGYNKWVSAHGRKPQQDERQRSDLENALEQWALSLMRRDFEDPILKQRIIKLVVDISSRALDKTPSFALKVLEHILMTHVDDHPEYPAFSDAVRELQSLSSHELRRLSMRYADYFSTFYDVLEPKIKEITASHKSDDKLQTELTSILLIITQRASNVEPYVKESRLQAFLDPVRSAWQNEEFKQMCSTFDGFCTMLGLERVGPYMQSKQAHTIDDWSTIPIDDEGRAIQDEMTAKFQLLPLRGTKTLLGVSTEKLKKGEPAYELACSLWRDTIPIVLPTLLQFLSHAHAFHNPDNWGALSNDLRSVVGKVLTDRFWQAGISTGSRDDFYTRITTSKTTLEGFASSVRGKVRAARETCYSTLFSMSRLREHFYGFEELAVPLSEALLKDSIHLSSHQFSVLLNIARCLIDDCPVQFRGHFLPPMIATLFTQIDKKVTAEWDSIEQRKAGLVDGDLTEEMKDESILRQLTYAAVVMVASLLDPQRGDPDQIEGSDPSAPPPTPALSDSIRHFVLSSPSILEPVILFCTHVLRMRDTRCCGIITRVLRSILQDFAPPASSTTAVTIREFISSEVLRACITSVHEPYFVDMQKDLAQLIASIWVLYGSSTTTPRSVILSLPGMNEQRVSSTEMALIRSTSSRQQRALILDLLEGLRGVSISEQGKLFGTREDRRKARSAMQERYMTNEMDVQEKPQVNIDDGPDLGGIADMFG